MLPKLDQAEMEELAGTLEKRGYPGGTQALAAEARTWIAGCEWADLDEDEIRELTDAQALSGAARKAGGGLEGFITICGYPPGSSR
jgi:hypothetical protein